MAEALGRFAAPSATECALIQESILQMVTDISQLDSEIERVEKLLEKLRHNRTALQAHRARYQNLLNPTRRLPVEILGGEIFILHQKLSLGDRSLSVVPAQICRHWRDVALATSGLWDFLKIRYPEKHMGADLVMIQAWLERSGGLPLRIELGNLGGPNFDYDKEDEQYEQTEKLSISKLMIEHTHRWKIFKLAVTRPLVSFLEDVSGDLPMLRVLRIDGHADTFLLPDLLKSFREASALRILSITGHICASLPGLLVPWAHLTTCALVKGRYTCNDAHYVLNQAVGLRFFTMSTISIAPPPDSPPLPPIHSNLLRSLDVVIMAGQDSHILFNLLTLPALSKLRVFDHRPNGVPEYLTPLITRSGCSLKNAILGTQGPAFTHHALADLFRVTPKLSQLKLQFCGAFGMDNTLMDLLIHDPEHAAGSCCLLPRLRSLESSIHSDFSYEKYAEFLASRCQASVCDTDGIKLAQLRTATLLPWDSHTASGRRAHKLPQETFNSFLAMRDGGLDLSVSEGGERLTLEEYFEPGEEEDDTTESESEESGESDEESESE
ncbi:hypothetical protein HWV62_35478 [Athelia sp. TMB]|nr:hypothetical protein HWV62_35478 [Athelia sp. TMB]